MFTYRVVIFKVFHVHGKNLAL